MAMLIGIGELTSAAFVLTGFLTRPAVIFQGVILVGAMSMFGFDFTAGPGIWKDPALLGIAASLAIFGSGKFGIDQLIANKLKPSDSVFEK